MFGENINFFDIAQHVLLDNIKNKLYNNTNFAEVAKRQTRKFQVLVVATPYGFKSHLLHQNENGHLWLVFCNKLFVVLHLQPLTQN